MILANANRDARKTVIFIEDEKISNIELLRRVDSFARFLRYSGVQKEDKVALVTPNCVEFLISFFAIGKIGGIVVPVNNMLKEEEYRYILNNAEAKMLITSSKFSAQTKELQATTEIEKTVWIDTLPEALGEHFLFSEAMTIPSFDDKSRA